MILGNIFANDFRLRANSKVYGNANENMNRFIRQYLPKGTCFDKLTPQKVSQIQRKLNNRPRKRLD